LLVYAPHKIAVQIIVLAATTIGLAGCDWVDGVGQQSVAAPSIEVVFDDGEPFTVATLSETDTVLITTSASDQDGIISTWRWSDVPSRQGDLAQCEGLADYDADLAANSLQSACVSSGCAVSFELREVASTDGESVAVSGSLNAQSASTIQFLAEMPALSAPVGVTYSLTATDNRGGRAISEHTFCINSKNDPPIAIDDNYTLSEAELLQPSLTERHLLENDIDDNDVRTQALEVVLAETVAPLSAAEFELFADGTFRYAYGGSLLDDDDFDQFQYTISDGLLESSATVTLRIVASNEPPVLVGTIPTLFGVVGVSLKDDLGVNVQDPEQGTLTFTADPDTLPLSGAVSVSLSGLLQGAPTQADIGSYNVAVTASDGSNELNFVVPLSIISNAPVEARDIPNQEGVVGERISFRVNDYFFDPESQPLRFDIVTTSSAVNLTISPSTGLVTGFVTRAGRYTLSIVASDGVNRPTTTPVVLDVSADNRAPVFSGSIATQTLRRGVSMGRIVPNFDDPDGDELMFSVSDALPPGVSISPTTGVISGRPNRLQNSVGVRIIATDPDGLTAESNAFSLFVR